MRTFLQKCWPFALLCFASFARFLLADNFPAVLPTVASLAWASGSIVLCCAAFLLAKHTAWPRNVAGARTAFAGALLLCGPVCPLFLRATDIVESDILLAGTLVPVVAAIVSAAGGNTSLSARTLWPGLAASAALLLMLPEPRVHSLAGALTLLLLPTAAGTGAVLVSKEMQDGSKWAATFASLGACVVFGFATLFLHAAGKPFPWQACGFDFAILSATLLVLRRLDERQYSSYFLLVPLFVLVYGLLLFRPNLNWRMAVGILTLLASATALLRTRNSDDDEPFRLLT